MLNRFSVPERLATAALAGGLVAVTLAGAAYAAGDTPTIPRQQWSFSGVFGHYDQGQLQRGFQVYQEKCALCHNLRLVKFRNLGEPGGPGFSEPVVKELAKPAKVAEINDAGRSVEREGRPTDPILVSQFKNEQEARAANNGALPPDFSVIAKARSGGHDLPWYREPFRWLADIGTGYQENGPDYIYALMLGYGVPPAYQEVGGKLVRVAEGQAGGSPLRCASVVAGEEGRPDSCTKLSDGMNYNAAFPGHQIAMPPPMAADNFVKYQDGGGSLEQNARDVSAFLMWASEPHLDARKRVGFQVLLFLAVTALLLWLGKRRLWSRIEH